VTFADLCDDEFVPVEGALADIAISFTRLSPKRVISTKGVEGMITVMPIVALKEASFLPP